MLTRHRTATVERVLAHPRIGRAGRNAPRTEQVLAPLCILAAGAAFAAEVLVGTDAPTFGALAVVPVLAATLLRSRTLTFIVVAFAVLLQVWGVGAGAISRDAAGMQIAVYLLTLAVIALQQARPSLRSGTGEPAMGLAVVPVETARPLVTTQVAEAPAPPSLIRVAGRGMAPPSFETEADPPQPCLPLLVADALTRREREVVLLAARGLTAREIGVVLFIGDRTVETHLANAYGKLGVRSKVELVRLVAASADDHTDLRTGTEAHERVTA